MVWLAITKSGKLVDVSGANKRPTMLPPCSSWDMPAWVSIDELMAHHQALEAENAKLREAIEQIRRYADSEEVEMVCKEALAACDEGDKK